MIEAFHYQVRWRSNSALPGLHRSTQAGGEQEFYGHAPLVSRPEAHNLDIHASLLDPFQQFVVRTFRQRGIINVALIADLSASMAFGNKMQRLADFTHSAAYSAYRTGDNFCFYGCDSALRPEFYLPPRWYKGGTPELADQLRRFLPQAPDCLGISAIHDYLPQHRSLVFLISDFHFPLHTIARICDALVKHDVVPIVLWDSQEYDNLPQWGLVRLYDAETGHDRHLLMRPALKEKIKQHFLARRSRLQHLFMRYGRQPFFVSDQFQADRLTRYFYEQ